MSIKISRAVWQKSKQTSSALLVLLALADFADDQGYAWPSNSTLAIKCRFSRRYIQKIISNLLKSGEIIKANKKKGYPSNVYFLKIAFSPDQQEDRNNRSPQDDHMNAEDTSYRSPNPSLTHQINHQSINNEVSIKTQKIQNIKDPLLINPAVMKYREVTHIMPNPIQRRKIAEKITDINLWEETVIHWMEHGWNKMNVAGIIGLYLSGGPKSCQACRGFSIGRPKQETVKTTDQQTITADQIIKSLQGEIK